MRYTYEFKKECVELYRQGQWAECPEGISEKRFKDTVREWVRIEEAQGCEALKHKNQNKVWSPDEKLELVLKVISGQSNKSVALNAGINQGML
ncbi:MAG: helix-turn-helix domain-containing protein, partial [Firmicutes bacterium]|nr:helix-turn-helix domain-containing protein [Bacillota bacterium]